MLRIFFCLLALVSSTVANGPDYSSFFERLFGYEFDAFMNTPSDVVLDGATIISLDRHMHRFEETKRLMESAGFTNVQRFEAIDGYFAKPEVFESLNIYTGSPGQKGCTASHLLVWEQFLNSSDKEWLFITEDDMLPHSDFVKLFPLYWERTPKYFDLVMVGNQMTVSNTEPMIVSKPCYCAHAYIISKAGAKKLLNVFKTAPGKNVSWRVIDEFLMEVMNGRYRTPEPLYYYCYNGSIYEDVINMQNGSIFRGRDNGICFQNRRLGTTLQSVDIVLFPN